MPEVPGTIPAIKERPKVARRPTIPAAPTVKTGAKASKAAALPVRNAEREKAALAESLAKERAKLETSDPIAQKDAEPLTQPVCAVAAAAVPAPLEASKATALAVPSVSNALRASFGLFRSKNSSLAAVSSALAASTIPPVRERPKVAKKPTIPVAKTMGKTNAAKKLFVKQAAAPGETQQSLAANWVNWAPLAAGIVLGFLSPQLHALASQWDPWGLRIVFPVVQVLGLREIGMSDELTRTLPQLMLYLQFPLEGLLVAMNLRRRLSFSMAIGPIPALHFICGLVLWIVALGSLKPI